MCVLRAQRNLEIVKLWRAGWTYQRIADKFEMSASYVGYIVRRDLDREPVRIKPTRQRRSIR
jgi:DNA-binding CsgD family transcriptional regulator